MAGCRSRVVAGVTKRAARGASFAVLDHLHWIWIPVVIMPESASMAAFAIMLRRPPARMRSLR
jgi:hypothetical protein